ncbi:ABC transporter ATP-binding protein [Pseudomonas sp. RIT-PI-S]|uniref:ABC transporter ATP-binding protein n=1 Tax=Pseudomonas sp. RIT-PI-S TaxID=3035295 RepID=UPI0021D91B10|nr:ABC transporter ATP-binding protein [Pseudomonas sp. RIT-PI-S]
MPTAIDHPSPLLDLGLDSKRFAHTAVLGRLRLQLAEGEIVSLLGQSGCGKSTLLRIAAGLDRDYRGTLRRQPGNVAFVFQEPRLMPWLTVEQNVGFADDDRYDRPRVRQLIAEVGLAGFEHALPKALSGGMAQRVAIARGLYGEPRVLLLDEPFSAVDAFTRFKLQDLLLQLARRHGIALLVVTHDVDEALYLSDRVLVIGNRPGTVRRSLAVALPHPRERGSDLLARLKAEALAELQVGR